MLTSDVARLHPIRDVKKPNANEPKTTPIAYNIEYRIYNNEQFNHFKNNCLLRIKITPTAIDPTHEI